MEKKYRKKSFLSAENQLFFSRKIFFFGFLVVFDPLFGVITPPDQKNINFCIEKNLGEVSGQWDQDWRSSKFTLYSTPFYLITPIWAALWPKWAGLRPNPYYPKLIPYSRWHMMTFEKIRDFGLSKLDTLLKIIILKASHVFLHKHKIL